MVWHQIKDLPPTMIGIGGLSNAVAKQILYPDKEIILGRLGATFKIVKVTFEEAV